MLADAQNWWLFAGKFHPVIVHFPIGLILAAAVLEVLRLRRGRPHPSSAAVACLVLGALSAIAASALGWSDAVTSGHQGSDAWVLLIHRWIGIAAAVVATLAAVIAGLSRALGRDPDAPPTAPARLIFAWYRFSLLCSAALVAIAGHFGGSLIYGADYFPDSFAKARGIAPAAPVTLASAARLDFTRDIQPIFARRCYQCHAGEHVEGDLHLDSLAGARKGGRSGRPAIVPGSPASSELIRLVKGDDPKRLMPPKNGTLEQQQIATLEAWIAQGASWPASPSAEPWHWAYRPPVRLNPPPVRDTLWPRNAIDHFILARLESEHLKPSSEADKRSLLRRVSLDLTGLPPTPDELAAFEADNSPLAYERAVDRLLASPHYGERMAMKWLDLARYADTHGYEKDNRRTMWPYRDWVIDAFNRDEPFDQFTIDQLAGDLLPDPTLAQIVATGFNRNTQTNEEGGVDAEEFRIDAVIDRTNTVASVWLGTTLACAQCHNHKNDPITQEDYYRVLACFNNDVSDVVRTLPSEVRAAGGMVPVAAMENADEFERLRRRIADLSAAAPDRSALAPEQSSWEREQPVISWSSLQTLSATSANKTVLTPAPDGCILASGPDPETDTYTIDLQTDLPRITALRLELLPDESTHLIGRSPHGNIVLSSLRIEADGRALPVSLALADFEQVKADGQGPRWTIADTIDGDPRSGWAIKPQQDRPHTAVFKLAAPISSKHLRVTLAQNFGGKHTLARFRLSATPDANPQAAAPLSQDILAILASPSRTAEQSAALADYFLLIAPSLALRRDELGRLRARQAELTAASAMVMKRADEQRQTHIFTRGSFLSPAAPVSAGLPKALLAGKPAPDIRSRLDLARWLVSPDNPLTARVTVNRLWEQHFSRGIVETSEDFGTQGDYPTHPELLDYLATELPRQGWSLKAIHRLIVTSAAYRQSSAIPKDLLDRDPGNRLLARYPRTRVEAETIRDIALAASGLLADKLGGPSVFPPQPDGVWTMIYSSDQWTTSTGPDRYRRGIYTFSRRTAPYPAFTTFDSTSREVMCTRRARTNTPLQALTTLNDPQYIEAAIALAARVLRESGPGDAARIAHAFELATSRPPTDAESARLLALLALERDTYTRDLASAQSLLAPYPQLKHDDLKDSDLAPWTILANVVLNLDETITRQ